MSEDTAAPTRIGAELYLEVLQFLYREAQVLDDNRFHDWLELLSDDIVYEMPGTLTRDRSEQDRIYDEEIAHFAENIGSLRMRVARLDTEYAWAEDPPTRTRHLVSNVVVAPAEEADALIASCAFVVYVNRTNRSQYDLFVGNRRDVLRRESSDLRIARRTLWLDQAIVGVNSISVFL